MIANVVWTNQFKKDYKLAKKRHMPMDKLHDIMEKLAKGESLPPECMG